MGHSIIVCCKGRTVILMYCITEENSFLVKEGNLFVSNVVRGALQEAKCINMNDLLVIQFIIVA